MPKIQFTCHSCQVTGTPWSLPEEYIIWRYQYLFQILCTMYYNWLSCLLIIPHVGIIDEQARAGPEIRWLGILQYLYVTLLDHADVGFLPPQHFIPLNPHAIAGATAFFDIQNIKNSLGNASGKAALYHSNLSIVWMHYFHSQALFTWYYDWWSHLIISQVGIIFEQVLSGSVVCWLGTLQYLYVTLLDHADVGFLPPQHFITLNPHAFAGATAFFDIQNIKNSLGNASDPTALWHSNLLQDTNFWKLDTYSSLHQVSKESSLHQACLACLMLDAVSIPPRKVDICSSWQQVNKESWYQACLSSLMPHVENTLSRRLILCYDRSEFLCSDWAISILQDSNFWKEAPNTHSSSHQAGKECSCYEACPSCMMPDAVNIPILKSSLRFLETRRYISISKEASVGYSPQLASSLLCLLHVRCWEYPASGRFAKSLRVPEKLYSKATRAFAISRSGETA